MNWINNNNIQQHNKTKYSLSLEFWEYEIMQYYYLREIIVMSQFLYHMLQLYTRTAATVIYITLRSKIILFSPVIHVNWDTEITSLDKTIARR